MTGRRAGFTLIEMLVALVILATMAGVLVMSLSGFDQRHAERETERFAALLRLACEQAELSGRELGVHVGIEAYGFSLADRDGWLQYPASHRFHERALEGVHLVAHGGTLPVLPDYERAPQLVCWPTGELSAFDLRFVHEEREWMRVRTSADGRPAIEAVDDRGDWRSWR
jgi:general secretion pathway protein H